MGFDVDKYSLKNNNQQNDNLNFNFKNINIDLGSDNFRITIGKWFMAILIIAMVWMSWSRLSNIYETYNLSLNKETKYECVHNKNLKDYKIIKFIYEDEKPNNLKALDKITTNEDYMYVLTKEKVSNIFNILKQGIFGFILDLIIVLAILSFIYYTFTHYYEKLIFGYNKINKQLSDFYNVFETVIEKDDTEKDKFEKFKENYDNILDKIKGNKNKGIEGIEFIGNLWWEFCETLIIIREQETTYPNSSQENNPIEKLRNTDQVEVYVNSDIIVDKQISREMYDVLPGILTGLGLAGTFTAIAVALMGFDMGHIELSIQNLLGGLSIKFISSLAGIVSSIYFIFLKSKLFAKLESRISDVQLELNSIFPRRTAESYLCYIWEEIELCNERLDDLQDLAQNQKDIADGFITNMSVKIKEVLENSIQKDVREVLDGLNENLSKSISGNLEGPLNRLIEVMEDVKLTKEESSSKAITDVLERIFNKDSFKNASTSMAQGLTDGINDSVSKMSEQGQKMEDLVQSIGGYVSQLHSYESEVERHYSELLDNLNKALNTQTDFVNRNQDFINALEDASNKISSTSSNLGNISDRIGDASEGFSKAADNVGSIIETSGEIVSNTADLNNTLERVFEQFKDRAENSVEGAFNKFGEAISEICAKIQTAVGGLEEIDFDELQESIETLSEILRERRGG